MRHFPNTRFKARRKAFTFNGVCGDSIANKAIPSGCFRRNSPDNTSSTFERSSAVSGDHEKILKTIVPSGESLKSLITFGVFSSVIAPGFFFGGIGRIMRLLDSASQAAIRSCTTDPKFLSENLTLDDFADIKCVGKTTFTYTRLR
jgi:hypothetical protein